MLNWDFKRDRIGTWKETHGERTYTYNLYSGNALLIMVAEWEEEGKGYYQVANFFADKDHAQNCLGNKGNFENIFKEIELDIELTAQYGSTKWLVQQIAKAKFDNPVKITILPNKPW